jgi:hypothetical protein
VEILEGVAHGTGNTFTDSPAVSLYIPNEIYPFLTVNGATAGSPSSYSYYVRDGDSNDKDPVTLTVNPRTVGGVLTSKNELIFLTPWMVLVTAAGVITAVVVTLYKEIRGKFDPSLKRV